MRHSRENIDLQTDIDLARFDADWPSTLACLAPEMHPVDRDACLIWFQFFPLGLHALLEATPDRKTLEHFYQFRGSYRLSEMADTSHRFLYGHRYWPTVKEALVKLPLVDLTATICDVADRVGAPSSLTLAISAIGLMTLRQTGPSFLTRDYVPPPQSLSADEVLSRRATDARAGWLAKRKPRVIIDERQADGWFPLVPGQHITTAAELDKRPHHVSDSRCAPGNGAIPVHCRAGSCGTCWVGVLGGQEKLTPVDSFERKRMEYFGYWESPLHDRETDRPLLRLACQTVALGSCSIVIPPWNGVWSTVRREAAGRRDQ